MRRLVLLLSWFPITIGLLLINLMVLSAYAKEGKVARLNAAAPVDTSFQLTAAAGTSQVLSANIVAGDARALLLQSFLRRHGSPMTPHADLIVAEADRFGLDFRMLPAIAMCESNLGKRMPKRGEYNFAGIAVYTGQNKGKAFDSWEHAIEWVSKYIKERYYDRGYTNLYDIGAIWAPPSKENGYSWTNCVEKFMGGII